MTVDWKSSAAAGAPARLLSSVFPGAAVQIGERDLRRSGESRNSTPTPAPAPEDPSVVPSSSGTTRLTRQLIGGLVSLIAFIPRRQKAEKVFFCRAR